VNVLCHLLWRFFFGHAEEPVSVNEWFRIQRQVREEQLREEVEEAAYLDWSQNEHWVYEEGYPVRKVPTSPAAIDALTKHPITMCVNYGATEPRWEATDGTVIAFNGDPNVAILECARQIEQQARLVG
jgi:hypothetical protein